MKRKTKISIFIAILVFAVSWSISNTGEAKNITVKNITKMTGATDSRFTDEKFYQCVIDYYNSENNTNVAYTDTLSDEQLSTITEVVCKNKGVTNISGVEKLTAIRNLDLNENSISSVDLSKNTSLQMLNLTYNNLSNIDVTNNIELQGLYLNGNNLTTIDVSKNTKLLDLNINDNNISTLNVTNNTLLQYILVSSNNLTSLDLSKNTKLQHIYASGNSISNISLPDTDTITRLDLHYNKITSIDVSKQINLEYLILSTNKLSNIDLSKNTNLTELYISSNNLSSLNLSNLTKLKAINAVFNNFDNFNIPYPQNITDLVVEADWIINYDFSKFTNLKSIRVTDYYVIPVYGSNFAVTNLYNYKSSNVDYKDYILYSDFNYRSSEYINTSDTITGNLGWYSEYTVCSTNVKDHHNSCGNDITDENPSIDDNVTISNLTSYDGIIYYEGYRELRYMTLTSDKYIIDEENNTIDVETDNDSTILNNLKMSWTDANLKITGNTLNIYYNDKLIRQFKLKRITNPTTGSTFIYIVGGLILVSIITILIIVNNKKKKNKTRD